MNGKSLLLGWVLLLSAIAYAQPQGTAEDASFDYEFGRPIQPGEMTYGDYRRIHAQHAEKSFGLDARQVEDGMDTWHWWVGVDNPGFWRDMAKLTGSRQSITRTSRSTYCGS